MGGQPGCQLGDHRRLGPAGDHVLAGAVLPHQRAEGGAQAGHVQPRRSAEADLLGRQRPAQLARVPGRHQPAAVHDDHGVGQPLGLLELVGGQDDAAALVPQRPQQGSHLLAAGHVDRRRRLVQEQDLGRAGQRQGQRQPLLFATGQLAPRRPRPLTEPDHRQQLGGAAAVAVVGAEQGGGLLGPDPGVDPALLQHDPHPPHELAVLRTRVEAQHPHPAGSGAPEALEHLDCRCLAGSVGPEQRGDRARFGGERQTIHGHEVAVADDQVLDLHRSHDGRG